MKRLIIEYVPIQGKDPVKELMAAVMDILNENNAMCNNIAISADAKREAPPLQVPCFMLQGRRQQA